MNFRWTMKELAETSSKQLLTQLINERMTNLNPYAPLAKRLNKLSAWVEKNVPNTEDLGTTEKRA